MTGYKCDRCGQWHTGCPLGYLYVNLLDAENEVAVRFNDKTYDFCPDCLRSVVSYVKNSATTSD